MALNETSMPGETPQRSHDRPDNQDLTVKGQKKTDDPSGKSQRPASVPSMSDVGNFTNKAPRGRKEFS